MTKKRRICERLEDYEALVVAPLDILEHVEEVYTKLAEEQPEFHYRWLEVAEHFRYWIDKTSYQEEEDYDDE